MKVLQVLPELSSGGVEAVTLGLSKHLVAQGHQSLVMSHGGSLVPQLEEEGSQHFTKPVHHKSLLALRHIPAIKRLLLEEQPDILHLRSRAPAWLCYLAWKQLPAAKRPKLVTTVHGFYSVNRYSQVMTRGEKVICVSQSIADYVRANYQNVSPENLSVIYEGIDPTEYPHNFQPSTEWRQSWQNEFPETNEKKLLLLPGRITRLKGHETFLELIAQLSKTNPNIHGLIVGGVHPKKVDYLAEIKALAQNLGISHKVTFTGRRQDLREIQALSQISFSLSQKPESFGLTVLEALSLGKPVIGYQDGGVAEILHELFPAGAVPRNNFDALLKQTEEQLTHHPAISNNEIFLSERSYRDTVATYQKLLERP